MARVGGAIGDIRATIDNVRFNDYIAVNVPEIAAPVEIKQFQVCISPGVGFCGADCGGSYSMDR